MIATRRIYGCIVAVAGAGIGVADELKFLVGKNPLFSDFTYHTFDLTLPHSNEGALTLRTPKFIFPCLREDPGLAIVMLTLFK